MDRPTYSQDWHRIGPLKPRLRTGVAIHRRHFRGRRGYVVHDPAANQFFRLDPVSHHLLGMLDGHRTVDDAWLAVSELYGDAAPTQNEVVGLLGQMYATNLLSLDRAAGAVGGASDGEQLFERLRQRRSSQMKQQVASVLFWKIPLFDPAPVLDFLLPLTRWILQPWALLVWAALVLTGIAHVIVKLPEFRADAIDFLKPDTLLMVGAIYVLTKIVHEFGHGLMCRRFGGAVHDMGLRMLVFTPVPYCDATSSWGLPSRWQRALVALAGIIVETSVAAVAAIIWARSNEGVLHDAAYNTVWIAGIASLLFNSNPLLRYDGYYVLSDILDIPNLLQRANGQLTYLVKRWLLGMKQVRPVTRSKREQLWLLAYAIASWTYRLIVFPAILLFVSQQFFGLGVLLTAAAFIAWVLVPLGKFVHFLATDPGLNQTRWRAVAVCGGGALAAIGIISLLPMPENTYASAVIESSSTGQRLVVMQADGFIENVLVADGQPVHKGQPLFAAINPELDAKRQEYVAQIVDLEVRLAKAADKDPATQRALKGRLESVRRQVANVEEDIRNLSLPSPLEGVVVGPDFESLSGRFIKRGEVLGLVRAVEKPRATAVLDQAQNAALFRDGNVTSVQLRVRGSAETVIPARVEHANPAAVSELPHAALGNLGGGPMRNDMTDPTGKKSTDSFYVVYLAIDDTPQTLQPGQRAMVRFTLEPSPLAMQWYRKLLRVLDGQWLS